ncbi:glycosyltransferase [bacterium]|nr:glycosyltransferase [bacterium]
MATDKMDQVPKVSIVIPTYNYGLFIAEAIESVLNQTFQGFEIIVVDDGSTDNTKDIVRSFIDNRIQYFYQENKGAPAARNRGFGLSKGEFILFLDSDNILMPNALEHWLKCFKENNSCGVVYSDLYYIDGRGKTIERLSDKIEMDVLDISETLCRYNIIDTSAALIRRRCLESIGVFNEALPCLQDWDLMFRISLKEPICFVNAPLVKVLIQSESICRGSPDNMIKKFKRVIEVLQTENLKLQNPNELFKRRLIAVYFYLIDQYGRKGEPQKISEIAQETLKIIDELRSIDVETKNIDKAQLYYNWGSAWKQEGLLQEAMEKFEEVINLAYNLSSVVKRNLIGGAHFHLGCIYKRLGEKEAKHHFEKCLKIIPDHKKARENLTKCLYEEDLL